MLTNFHNEGLYFFFRFPVKRCTLIKILIFTHRLPTTLKLQAFLVLQKYACFHGSVFKACILIVFANIISCSFSHLYIIIKAGLCNSMWSCGYSLYCCILRGTKNGSGISWEQMWNDTFSFRKPNVIIMSLSLLLLERLVDVVSWQSK